MTLPDPSFSNQSPEPEPISRVDAAVPSSGNPSQGCLHPGLLILAGLWILATTVGAQIILWAIEQALFEGSLPVSDLRWAVGLGYGLAVFLPLLAGALLVKTPWLRPIFRAWMLASVLALILFPARLIWITSSQTANLAQLAGLLIFLVILLLVRRRVPVRTKPHPAGISLALILALLFAIPWVLYGALGSPIDTLLNLVVGLLFGLDAALLIENMVTAVRPSTETGYSTGQVLLFGLAAALALLILATAVGQDGSQILLAVILPILGWGVVPLILFSRAREGKSAWLAAAVLIGLSTAWPLMFVDPDELSIVTSSGPGELIDWVTRIVLLGSGLILLAVVGLLISHRRIQSARPWRGLARLGPVLTLAVVAAIFFLGGRPGFYGERLFVILKDQADVSQAAGMKDPNARRAFVYTTLVDHANQTQIGLRQGLDRIGVAYTPYYLVNALEVRGGPLIRLWLRTRPEVDRVLDSPILRPLPAPVPISRGSEAAPASPQWNLDMIGAPRVWEMGYTGQGIVVGQSDSGVQGDHPELAASYHGAGGKNDYNWLDPWNHSAAPQDIGGHGTHTTGSILGKNTGVAPGATWIGCVNLARNLGNPAFYLDCMQFMLAPYPQNGDPLTDGKPELGAQVLNNSWGCPDVEGCDPETFLPAVHALRSAGIFVVVSAGNAGYSGCGSVKDPPAIYQEVYSVGAVGQTGDLASFSSLGPVTVDGSQRIKPDITAPGEGVLSAFPGSTYSTLSGTSMAGPHVVGVVALMWSANPALIGDIDRTEQILDQTAVSGRGGLPDCVNGSSRPNDAYGYGVVDAYAAVQKALEK